MAGPFGGGFVDAEALDNLGNRGALIQAQHDADNVIVELFQLGLRHGA